MKTAKTKVVKAWACVHKPPTPQEWRNDFQTHPADGDCENYALSIFEEKEEANLHVLGTKHLIIVPCTITYSLPHHHAKK